MQNMQRGRGDIRACDRKRCGHERKLESKRSAEGDRERVRANEENTAGKKREKHRRTGGWE